MRAVLKMALVVVKMWQYKRNIFNTRSWHGKGGGEGGRCGRRGGETDHLDTLIARRETGLIGK